MFADPKIPQLGVVYTVGKEVLRIKWHHGSQIKDGYFQFSTKLPRRAVDTLIVTGPSIVGCVINIRGIL